MNRKDRKENRKKIEQKIKKNKDIILEWTIVSNKDNNVFVHGYFDYDLISFNDNDVITDTGIRFYSHDGFKCNTLPHNPFMKDLKDDEELKRYNLYEELKPFILCTYDMFWSLFDSDLLFIENDVYTMYLSGREKKRFLGIENDVYTMYIEE